ncbi:hypothetical protein SHELI_v1c10630 [Spiroplasma helicoides]|uniref:Uncharacterized protein n=1 Tax=Spiroplasma helicoides TaxID=216938 RepID=A0A1B3SM72_9MOLU|nr:hypothetical protein [Spiroplasma helicoides]AOG61010.1 hypothetical protein SHELI_v1c10630 [Spiroplasma helicoides]
MKKVECKKQKNNISLGIYKVQLFVQQLVLTNGKDWLMDVVSGLIEGFADKALDLLPTLKALIDKVPGASFILHKFVITPISTKLAEPVVNLIVAWAEKNAAANSSSLVSYLLH